MTLATLLGVWANPDDESYLSAALKARARDCLVEHQGVRRSHGHAGSTSRSSAARPTTRAGAPRQRWSRPRPERYSLSQRAAARTATGSRRRARRRATARPTPDLHRARSPPSGRESFELGFGPAERRRSPTASDITTALYRVWDCQQRRFPVMGAGAPARTPTERSHTRCPRKTGNNPAGRVLDRRLTHALVSASVDALQ